MATVKLTEKELRERFEQFTNLFYSETKELEDKIEKRFKILVRQARFRCLFCQSRRNLIYDHINFNRSGNIGILIYTLCLNCKRYMLVTEDGILTKSQNY